MNAASKAKWTLIHVVTGEWTNKHGDRHHVTACGARILIGGETTRLATCEKCLAR